MPSSRHTHHNYVTYYYNSWSGDILGIACKDCDKVITSDEIAKFVNALNKRLEDKTRKVEQIKLRLGKQREKLNKLRYELESKHANKPV